jgi:hypothetical protein
MTDLEKECDRAIVKLYRTICREVYDPTMFYQMIGRQGALDAARSLLRERNYHSGFARLRLENRLDLTVEAFILRNTRYYPLFTEQMLNNARKKLDELGYNEDDL